MKCQNCNQTVTRKSKFCPNCGTPVAPRKSQKSWQSRSNIPMSYAIGLVILGIVLGFAIFKYSSNPGGTSVGSSSNMPNRMPVQSAAVLDIAQEFMCPCGSCSDPLDACQCDHPKGALEVKNFIAQKLQEGHKKPHIIEMVQEQYGGLKSASEAPLKFNLPVDRN